MFYQNIIKFIPQKGTETAFSASKIILCLGANIFCVGTYLQVYNECMGKRVSLNGQLFRNVYIPLSGEYLCIDFLDSILDGNAIQTMTCTWHLWSGNRSTTTFAKAPTLLFNTLYIISVPLIKVKSVQYLLTTIQHKYSGEYWSQGSIKKNFSAFFSKASVPVRAVTLLPRHCQGAGFKKSLMLRDKPMW